MKLSQVNLLPELSTFLKYGLIGLGAIIAILSFLLLRGEQNKSKARSSNIKGIYAFMGLGVILALIGLVAPSINKNNQRQSSRAEFKNSNKNKSRVKQSGGSENQTSDLTLTDSDSNDIQVDQGGSADTLMDNE